MPASYSWLKLYYEILDDPKMGKLPDKLWRRVIECFLMAGKYGNTGTLPDISTMAWALRIDENSLTKELQEIEKFGIVEFLKGHWHVKKFAERQSATPSSERMLQMRHRHSYENVTARNTELDIDRESEEDKSLGANAPSPTRNLEPIAILKRITGKRSISEALYESLCDVLTSKPDEKRLKECWVEWNARGYKNSNWAWVLDWYKNGIPQRVNGNGHKSEDVVYKSADMSPEELKAEYIRLNPKRSKELGYT